MIKESTQPRPKDSSTGKKMPAWSFSSYQAYLQCPKRFYLTRVAKVIREPETEVLRWGNTVHAALEARVKDGTPLPEGMTQWEKYARWSARAGGTVHTELAVGVDENLKPVDFWAKDVWCRGKLDLTIKGDEVAVVLDWKTGKIRADSEQLKLFAGFAFAWFPEIQHVHTGYVWLNHDKVTGEHYSRDQMGEIWSSFTPAIQRIQASFASGDWPARPSGLCRQWCPIPRKLCPHSGLA